MPSTQTDRLYGLTTSVAVKPPVQISADYNVITFGEQEITSTTLTGTRTVTTTKGMRVLLIGQENPIDNGIWEAMPATWRRAPDFDGARDSVNGTLVFSVNGDCWQVEAEDPVRIGYDPINFRSTYPFSGDANLFQRSLRVPDSFIPEMPSLAEMEGKIVAIAGGRPVGVLPGDGTATDVMVELAKSTGSNLIGYPGGSVPSSYDDSSSVSGALNRLTERVVYATKYGVKADGVTDDTAALQALSVAVSAMTNPVVQVIFPQGTSIVGAQQQAPNPTSGYSFRPTYESTGGFGWFYVNERSGKTIIDAYGYKIKLKSGLKHGSFNPSTGAPYPSTAPFDDTNYQATVGNCATFRLNEDISVFGLTCDGSATSLTWGGPYGDIGWQCVSFGIYAAGNGTQHYEDVECHDAGTDAWYVSTNSGWTPPISGRRDIASMVRCIGRDSRRQGITIAGGGHIKLDQCQFYSIGRRASGAGAYYSAPEACLDIESESGSVYDFVANNCQFIDGRYTVVAASFVNPASRAHFSNCLMRTDSDIAQIYTTLSDMFFDNCVIQGSGIECRDTSGRWKTSFRSCSFTNFIGSTVAQFCTYVGTYGVVEDCIWDLIIDGKVSSNLLFAMQAGDLSSTPAYPQKGAFRFNRINLQGNQNLATTGSNGRIALGFIQFFYDMDFRVTGSGLTGTTLLQFDTGGSFVNQRGITCDSPKIVDSNLGTSIAMPTGGYMLPRTMSVAALALAPQVDNIMTIGTPSIGCANIYVGAGSGVVAKSPNGTPWKIVVSDEGVLSTIAP